LHLPEDSGAARPRPGSPLPFPLPASD
jgi:hypothetical protein